MVITPKPSSLLKGVFQEKQTDKNSEYFHNIIFRLLKYEIIFGVTVMARFELQINELGNKQTITPVYQNKNFI